MLDKHYDHKKVEKDKYLNWKNKGYFKSGDLSKTKFSLVIPPPNVTGKLHIGHAFDTTIQDIISRYKKSKGFDVCWLPGTDHAGIATEAKVVERLKTLGIYKQDLDRKEFLNYVWEWKNEYANEIHKQWEKMGLMLDYSKERFTLDNDLNKAVNHVFKKMYDEGLIYKGERIINWDPIQQTSLSNIEVIHKTIKGKFYYFKYRIVDSNDFLVVATTRPETMFGDVCLTVNPNDYKYKKYIGKYAINPANNEKLIIIADEYVDKDFGTGVMKCTPAHDPNDFIIGKKYNLPQIICINKDGTMNKKALEFEGLDRFECRKKLVEKIKNDGNLVKVEDIIHSVGHSERSGCIIEPYLSKQWFIKMKPLAQKSIELQKSDKKIEFIPGRFNKIFIKWMENIEDWCISRQLWWGHRIPAYYNKATGEILVSEEPPKDTNNYYQDEDVLDTWFSSALWPFSGFDWPKNTEKFKRYFPTDILVTGYDIIFFWVSRMINQSLYLTNDVPFKKVLIHGLIRDEQGRKMSKSLNNGIDPLDVINKYGVDALRYFLATSSTPGLDMRYSNSKIESSVTFLNKIWNASRFIFGNLNNYNEQEINKKILTDADKFILTKLENTIKNVTKNMDKYNLGAASTSLYNFVYDDFCSFYIETTKLILKDTNNEKYSNTQNVLLFVLKSIIMMIYPYSPFIAEELYLSLPNHKESIMLEDYPIFDNKFQFKDDSIKTIELLKLIIKDIRNYKTNNKIDSKTKLNIQIKSDLVLNNEFLNNLKIFCNIDSIEFVNNYTSEFSLIYPGLEIFIKTSYNKDELKFKLEKELSIENFEIQRCLKMLNNQNFLNKAPKDKIQLEKEKLESHNKLKEQILIKLKKL